MTRLLGLLFAAFLFAGSEAAVAEMRGELSALANWVGNGQQSGRIEGRVAKALGLTDSEAPINTVAVTTPYLDGSRIVYVVRGPGGEHIVFAQGQARQGRWYLSNRSGRLLRAIEWVPTSAHPQPLDPRTLGPAFTEMKAFWKAQVSRGRRR
ncbi:MAG: hypothetical protein KIT16_19495 [Rhodospirillaceae bacterium]|nr:hypothetical protein [Rhodospirillaceae bacterium]